MMRQGTLCWMLVLAPIMASADDDGPISALDAASGDSTTRVVALADIELAANDAGSTATIEADGTITLELAVATAGEYWIGLDCEQPGDTLRSQLSLPKDTGLVIAAVSNDSPAKLAGLLTNDVVTVAKLGDKTHPISSVDQFSALIQEAKATPIELTVVREGKPTPVSVTPAARQGLALVKGEHGGKPRALQGQGRGMVFRFGGPAAKKSDGDKGQHHGHHAHNKDGDHHQRGHGASRRQAGHRHGRHMAHHDRGGHGGHGRHGQGWQGHRGHHPRHLAQRGSGRHYGRMAMMRHGRHGGFGHRGFGRGGFGHGGFGRGGFGHRGFAFGQGGFGHRGIGFGGFGHGGFGQHGRGHGGLSHRGFGYGSHFGNHFGFARRGGWTSGGGRSTGGSRIAMFLNMLKDHHGSHAFTRPVQSQRSTSGLESRLEALVTRLEKAAGSQGPGPRPEPGRGFGFGGGFRPEFGNRERGERREGNRPESNRPGPRGEPPRREGSGEGPSLDQMRGQLRQLAEQQENMMKAIRDLSEALEKSSRK